MKYKLQKPFKYSLLELIKAPSTYILFPIAFLISQAILGLLFAWPSSWGWYLLNCTMFSGVLLLTQSLITSIKNTQPVSTDGAVKFINLLFKSGWIMLVSVVNGMAVCVVLGVVAFFYIDFESTRQLFLTMTSADFQKFINVFLQLGAVIGCMFRIWCISMSMWRAHLY